MNARKTDNGNTPATWMGNQYVVTDTGGPDEWYSSDGNEWVEQSGNPVTGEAFDGATIELIGGPANGRVVR